MINTVFSDYDVDEEAIKSGAQLPPPRLWSRQILVPCKEYGAQGLLTNKYIGGIPQNSRALQGKSLDRDKLTEELIGNLRALNDLAQARNQTLAQMALAWVLRGGRVTTALIGASSAQQVIDCAQAVENLKFTDAELAEIDLLSGDRGINLWAQSSETA